MPTRKKLIEVALPLEAINIHTLDKKGESSAAAVDMMLKGKFTQEGLN